MTWSCGPARDHSSDDPVRGQSADLVLRSCHRPVKGSPVAGSPAARTGSVGHPVRVIDLTVPAALQPAVQGAGSRYYGLTQLPSTRRRGPPEPGRDSHRSAAACQPTGEPRPAKKQPCETAALNEPHRRRQSDASVSGDTRRIEMSSSAEN